eukprot:1938416-Rhodomonas_salina.1
MSNLGVLKGYYLRKFDEGEQLLVSCVSKATAALGAEHELTMAAQYCLALVLFERGAYREAEALYQACLDGREVVLGDGHPDTLATMHSLALVFERLGERAKVERPARCLALRNQRLKCVVAVPFVHGVATGGLISSG